MRFAFGLSLFVMLAVTVAAQTRPRGRELGIPFPGTTGPLNAIIAQVQSNEVVQSSAQKYVEVLAGDPLLSLKRRRPA